jgi:hypothetical protein
VHGAVKRFDLRQEPVRQFLARADRDGWNVVNGLIGVKLGALAAGFRNRIDNFRFQAKQSELENLKQATRPCSNNNYICMNHLSGPSNTIGYDGSGYCPHLPSWRPCQPAIY